MAGENQLFKIDVLMVDAKALAFEDATATVSGVAGFENDTKLSASGDDYVLRKRIERVLTAKIQFGTTVNPADFAKMSGVQITMRDSFSGRKCLANNCVFKSFGEVGAGSAELKFNLLSDLQWL